MVVHGCPIHTTTNYAQENANRAKALELGFKIQSLEEKRAHCKNFEESQKILQEISHLRSIQIALGYGFIEQRKPEPPKKRSKFFITLCRISNWLDYITSMIFIYAVIGGVLGIAGLFIYSFFKHF